MGCMACLSLPEQGGLVGRSLALQKMARAVAPILCVGIHRLLPDQPGRYCRPFSKDGLHVVLGLATPTLGILLMMSPTLALIDATRQRTPVLREDDRGVLRVGGTRIPLETVLAAYEAGLTVEEIVLEFDALDPADVHEVLSHALRHPSEVRLYLQSRARAGEDARRQSEARSPAAALRARLLARRERG
jgi:uncharacterized protein (DUF433 family)